MHPDYLNDPRFNPKGLTHWLWFDYETTGLWTAPLESPLLMQMGAMLLPFGSLDPDEALLTFEHEYRISRSVLERMDPVPYRMHQASGLLELCTRSSKTPYDTECFLLNRFEDIGIAPKKLAFAGTGIAPFDMPLMRINMFRLYEFGHYAPYDLGTGRRAMQSMFGVTLPSTTPDSGNGHTALADVFAMLEQARYLREYVNGGPKKPRWNTPPINTPPGSLFNNTTNVQFVDQNGMPVDWHGNPLDDKSMF